MINIFINRDLEHEILRLTEHFPVIVLSGPRQSGKTTLCKNLFKTYYRVDLDDASVIMNIRSSPKDFLIQYKDGLIIDEAQRFPELFSYIKVVVDEMPEARYILTGSRNFLLMKSVTESLAGRVALLTLLPLSLKELSRGSDFKTEDLLFNGGFPAVWAKNIPSMDIVKNYYNTYIERDIRQIINIKDINKFQIFIRLCAGRIGTEFNASNLSNEVGVSLVTVQEWLSILEASYVLFRLHPFYQNIGKRLVKVSKIYFYDTAMICFLLGIENHEQLKTHPLYGQIFENFVVLEFFKNRIHAGKSNNLFFYRDKSQHEIDIIQEFGYKYRAYEIKSATAFHSDFTKNLDYLKKLLGNSLLSTKVIFDGDVELDSTENGIINFRNIQNET
ncbi:MAG: ATP-binding protein [Bacteroidales bacterium]|jgi:predicted AAA+ superfamily ATPase|nr:ATP-binding protein [Bacteroidales bacterium]